MKVFKLAEFPFVSIQGEGYWTGIPMLFIRFAGCNLNCPFCDTDYSTKMEFEENQLFNIIDRSIIDNNLKHICFTGGEPGLQLNTDFIRKLQTSFLETQKIYIKIHVETNGLFESENALFWRTVSPKVFPLEENMKYGSEIKIIVDYFSDEIVTKLNDIYDSTLFEHYYIQPEWKMFSEINHKSFRKQLAELLIKVKHWKLSLQTHKILEVR